MAQTSDKLVTIIGGSGFLGSHIVRALAKRGYRIRVGVRRPDTAGHLLPLGMVGQIMPVQANVRYPASVAAACAGADAVINLVGVLAPSGRQTFEAVHVFGAEAVARAAREAGAKTMLHVSAIGADPESPAEYGRTKAEGEARVRQEFPEATVFRPSIVFGPEDSFFNRFAAMARFSPVLPLIGGGHTRFQPVFVGDIARAAAAVVDGAETGGKPYELGGPEVLTFRELMEFMLKTIRRKRVLMPVPFRLARLQASLLQLLPNPLLTVDQVTMLERDNVVGDAALNEHRTFEAFDIAPRAIEAIVPDYLVRFRRTGQYEPPQRD
ncbi:complex I NDUFA9 subunit family protein [Kaustia mangrovi]|uniref:Complex I NDUFA9 subunit family protein n=1 Tax=Kaustia mangrovi TaxID=2593653 RepID=A0A7S8HBV0_9HYPH|nr:complex I NDUFA9 subunit family protein [Kaustia mangrovi]QPC42583.1 complex I NDUFA9 subunit family protein [Kaustia mangrovi]